MAITFNLLIFHPNATLDEINENIVFMKRNSGYAWDFGRAEIVAGSPLEKQAISEGIRKGNWPNWDYTIKDAATEKLFNINRMTFRKEGCSYGRMVHQMIALTYHSHVVRHLYPGPAAEKLFSESNARFTPKLYVI